MAIVRKKLERTIEARREPLIDPEIVRRLEELERTGVDNRWMLELADELRASIPAEEWARLPTDGSVNLDHYLYGTPRVED